MLQQQQQQQQRQPFTFMAPKTRFFFSCSNDLMCSMYAASGRPLLISRRFLEKVCHISHMWKKNFVEDITSFHFIAELAQLQRFMGPICSLKVVGQL